MVTINTKIIRVETSLARPNDIQIFRGENVPVELHFANYGNGINLTGYSAEAYYQSPDMGDSWYKDETAGHLVIDGSGEFVTWLWTPDIDAGADKYRWFVRVYKDGDDSYRAFGQIEMLGSPSLNPGVVPIPSVILDFDKYTVLNAPYYTKSETDEAIEDAIAGIPAPVYPVVSVNGKTGAVALGASDIATSGGVSVEEVLDEVESTAEIAYVNAEGISLLIPPDTTPENQLADKNWVADTITQGTAIFRGNYATRAALFTIAWQTSDPTAPHYVSNNDYAVVQDDETKNDECWRYIYVKTGAVSQWTPQYMINERPLTQAQLAALNSGATSAKIASIAGKLDKTGGTLTGDFFVHDGYIYGHLIGRVDAERLALSGTALTKVEPADPSEPIRLDFGGSDGGTVAYLSDLPSLSGYATETFVNQQITNTVGTINSALDNINGEVI